MSKLTTPGATALRWLVSGKATQHANIFSVEVHTANTVNLNLVRAPSAGTALRLNFSRARTNRHGADGDTPVLMDGMVSLLDMARRHL